MSKHDHQGTDKGTQAGQFNGDDMEISPFMFDAAPEQASTATGQFGNADMEFEPFMFDQGEGFGLSSQAYPSNSGNQPSIQPFSPPVSGPLASSTTSTSPGLASLQTIEAPPELSVPASTQPSPPSFAGHEVPMPAYLKPSSFAPESLPVLSEPTSSAPPASEPEPSSPTGPFADNASIQTRESTGSVSPLDLPGDHPGTAPITHTEPLHQTSPISTQSGGTGPIEASHAGHITGPTAAPGPGMFSGMGGRSRGNTGPLSSTLPHASWSDSSLASIEDFSSVLIAMQAGKRLRRSGPLGEAMLSQSSSAAATATATATPPASTSTSTSEQGQSKLHTMPNRAGPKAWA